MKENADKASDKPAAEKEAVAASKDKPVAAGKTAKTAKTAKKAPTAKQPAATRSPARQPAKKATSVKTASAAKQPARKTATKATTKAATPTKSTKSTGPTRSAKVLKSTTAKSVSQPAAKPAPKTKPKQAEVKEKVKKAKLVRDSFTIPESEYQVLADVKKAFLKQGVSVKKTELLRAGLVLIRTMDLGKLNGVIQALAPIKAGRPKKEK